MERYVGVDGCRGGWLAAEWSGSGGWQTEIYANADLLWEAKRDAALILIDMPIGMAEGMAARRCDALARQRLRPGRASSVFDAPVREVLDATDYAEANALQRRVSGRGLSRQAWGLVPKIRSLDTLLRREPKARERIREAHPELCFAALFGGPMRGGKKTPEGLAERLAHLERFVPSAEALVRELAGRYPRSAAMPDDAVDALVLALSARIAGSGGTLKRLPPEEDADREGLPRMIVYTEAEGFRLGGEGAGH